jgi:SH3-like domain-containing protein
MKARWRLDSGAALALFACAVTGAALPERAHAADFKSVGDAPAILYDAPTQRGRKLSVAPRGMPVEIVVVQGDWDRVRDSSGEFSWIEKRALSDRRTLVMTQTAVLHGAADDHAAPLMRLDQGVLVELVEPPSNGYVHVRYRDGTQGWLKIAEVWGL